MGEYNTLPDNRVAGEKVGVINTAELKWGKIEKPSFAFTCKICGGKQPVGQYDKTSFPLCAPCIRDLNSIVTEIRVKPGIHGPKPRETADEYCKRPTEMKINNPLDERNRKLNLPKD